MTESTLSPAVQVVLAAIHMAPDDARDSYRAAGAAAIRAVANNWRIDTEFIGGVEYIRISTLDKIADELESK
jgi:hypothetical protein